jgi:spore coat polysaccharide biosynthesis protein SpsF
MIFKTEQEAFWAGDFGNAYINRNQGDALLASNLNLFSKALKATRNVKTCIEFGSNIGMNIKALKLLLPNLDVSAIEINETAAKELVQVIAAEKIYNTSILDFEPRQTYDLTLIKGVLIHINPDELPKVYDKLISSCSRYLMVAEYYNPSPVTVQYRGHDERLFKRDFAGEIMEHHPQLKLIDYGFVYRRDPNFPQDDVTWFLLEKN